MTMYAIVDYCPRLPGAWKLQCLVRHTVMEISDLAAFYQDYRDRGSDSLTLVLGPFPWIACAED